MTDLNTPGLVKREIRERIRKILLEKTDARALVFASRTLPNDAEAIPAILIYTLNENTEVFDRSPKRYRRDVSVAIECQTVGDDDNDLDLRLERLGDQVEKALEVDETLGDLVDSLELSGADYKSESNAESPTGNLILRYNVRYYLNALTERIWPPFEEVGNQWKVGHHDGEPDNVVEAEDEIEIET